MKGLKEGAILICAAGLGALCLSGCSSRFSQENIVAAVSDSVSFPEQYSIAYEVETAEGMIYTVKKSRDAAGNIYFKSKDKEMLFLAEEGNYILYQKNGNGEFVRSDQDTSYNAGYLDSVTEEFMRYAEMSKNQFIPGVKASGEQKEAGRDCVVYQVKIGTDNTAVSYSFLADKETGICLGWDEGRMVGGYELEDGKESFHCTEFITEDVSPLELLIGKPSAINSL